MPTELDVATLRLIVVKGLSSVTMSMIAASIDMRFLTAIYQFPEIHFYTVWRPYGEHTALDPGSARGGTQGRRPLCSDRRATPYPRQRPNPPNSSCGISRHVAGNLVPGSLQDHRQDFLGTSSRWYSTTGYPSGPREPLMKSVG